MSDLDLTRSKGLRFPDEADCLRCHDDEGPTWDDRRYVLADGSKVGFDFEKAWKRIERPIPTEVKGRYLELKKD